MKECYKALENSVKRVKDETRNHSALRMFRNKVFLTYDEYKEHGINVRRARHYFSWLQPLREISLLCTFTGENPPRILYSATVK